MCITCGWLLGLGVITIVISSIKTAHYVLCCKSAYKIHYWHLSEVLDCINGDKTNVQCAKGSRVFLKGLRRRSRRSLRWRSAGGVKTNQLLVQERWILQTVLQRFNKVNLIIWKISDTVAGFISRLYLGFWSPRIKVNGAEESPSLPPPLIYSRDGTWTWNGLPIKMLRW